MNRYKKFTLIFILFSIFIIIIIGLLNYIIDPYGIFNVKITSFDKIKQSEKIRLVKVIRTNEIKPKSIILGTSRAEYGYDPFHKYFIQPSYNLAISSGSMYENRLNFQNALKQGNLKKVLLVADYMMFNDTNQKVLNDFETYFDNFNIYKYLFSIDSLKDVFYTVKGTDSYYTKYLNNGQRDYSNKKEQKFKEGEYLNFIKKTELKYYKYYSQDYTYKDTGRSSFKDFEKIISDCYLYDIDLTVVFGPSHIRQWEALDYYIGYDKWLKWKKDVVVTINKIAKEKNKLEFRIVDFSVYHKFTSEKIPLEINKRMFYHWESSHYKHELGIKVLDKLYDSGNNSDFGVDLNIENIDVHLKKQNQKRQKFFDTKKHQIEVWGKSRL